MTCIMHRHVSRMQRETVGENCWILRLSLTVALIVLTIVVYFVNLITDPGSYEHDFVNLITDPGRYEHVM